MIFFRRSRIRLGRILFSAIFFLCSSAPFAENTFSAPNLNEKDEVLFALTHKVPGAIEYTTIFKAKIKNGTAEAFPQALTCFPERMEIFEGAKKLQVRNRYGTAVYDFSTESLKWTYRADSIPENLAAPMPVAMSPSGACFCSLERADLMKGNLVITDVASGKKVVLVKNCSFSYTSVPVKWSPDGENFLYEKDGAVYICNPRDFFKNRQVQEKFRKICDGSINSVVWNDEEFISYVSADLVFKISVKEIVSFGLYAQFLPMGKIIGRLPQKFDAIYDKFWISKDSGDIFIVRNDENISWYKKDFNEESGAFLQTVYSAPLGERELAPLGFNVFWTENGDAVLCVKFIRSGSGSESGGVYTINSKGEILRRVLIEDTYSDICVSPDKRHFAVLSGESVFLYSVSSWKMVCQINGERAVSLVWRDNGNLCIGGVRSVKKMSIIDYSLKPLFASSAQNAWWTSENRIAFKDSAGRISAMDETNNVWFKEEGQEKKAQVQNKNYRVFCGTTKNSLYKNAVYVRTLSGGITTKALIAKTAAQVPPRKKVALVFDANENADGLNSILAICNDYNLPCAFFFNGEFIRRYPVETRKISQTEHECAAVFFNNVDLTDAQVYRDKTFISKGLARLEDEFYNCTGKELSLYWHAPFNKADKKIRDEGKAAGYAYIDFATPVIFPIVGEKVNGRVPSISALYEKFNLLVNELFLTGADIVKISEL